MNWPKLKLRTLLRLSFLIYGWVLVCMCSEVKAQSETRLQKGIDYIWSADYDTAQLIISEVLSDRKQLSELDRGRAFMYLGRVEQLLSHYDSALVYLHNARRIFTRAKSYNNLLECETWLSEYHRSIEQFDEAKKYLLIGEDLITKPEITDFTKALFYSRKAAYLNEREYDPTRAEVLHYSRLANDLARKIGNKDLEATTVNEMGFAFENMRDERALKYYLDAYRLWQECGNKHYAAASLMNVVRESIKRKDYKEASRYAHIGFEEAEKQGRDHMIGAFACQIMQAEESMGNIAEALKYAHIYHNDYEIEMNHRWQESVVEIERKYDIERQLEQTETQKARAELASQIADRNRNQRNYLMIIVSVLIASIVIILFLLRKLHRKNVELHTSLDQKKVLLKEVYHRVKNNLTLLNGMLFLRSKSAKDPTVRDILAECQSRIHSMAIVHQQLYELNESAGTDLRDFCLRLLGDLKEASVSDENKLVYGVTGNIVGLELNNAVLVGLIINELAMNSIKHAGVGDDLRIAIDLQQGEGSMHILYEDNGVGLPGGVIPDENSGFGFRMINLLIKQLHSTISYTYSSSRSVFHIQLPSP